jgi:CHAD domain-containing protein
MSWGGWSGQMRSVLQKGQAQEYQQGLACLTQESGLLQYQQTDRAVASKNTCKVTVSERFTKIGRKLESQLQN